MSWTIEFFNEQVREETFSLPKKILAKTLHIFELVELQGANLGLPYTKSLDNGLFEIRAKGEEGIGRSIYCYEKNKVIIILHSFVKKSNKTPKRALDLALKRKKEL